MQKSDSIFFFLFGKIEKNNFFEIFFKNLLTSARDCDKILKLSARAGGEKRNWSLKIEQQERSTKHIKKYVRTNSKFLENTTQTKSKRS